VGILAGTLGVPLGLAPGFTKREHEPGATRGIKSSQHAECLPLMLMPKPVTWGAELKWAGAKALHWLWTHHPTAGASLSLPSKRVIGGESVPRCSLRYKHRKHTRCSLPTPEDFLAL